MTPSQLKAKVESTTTDQYFFARDTMRFFGDTMKNYGVRSNVMIETSDGSIVKTYELYRRRPVKHGVQSSAYFNAETFRRVFPVEKTSIIKL